MESNLNFISWIITTALMLISGFIALIRRIDNNKKDQELRDEKLSSKIDKTLIKIEHIELQQQDFKVTNQAIIEKIKQFDQDIAVFYAKNPDIDRP